MNKIIKAQRLCGKDLHFYSKRLLLCCNYCHSPGWLSFTSKLNSWKCPVPKSSPAFHPKIIQTDNWIWILSHIIHVLSQPQSSWMHGRIWYGYNIRPWDEYQHFDQSFQNSPMMERQINLRVPSVHQFPKLNYTWRRSAEGTRVMGDLDIHHPS